MMIKKRRVITVFILVGIMIAPFVYGQKKSQKFEFKFENKTLRGVIESPENTESSAVILIIPGSGRTDFVKGNWYSELRDKFVASGLTVCLWDKMGCGNSEGEFDNQQPVESSAKEAIEALKELKRLKIAGSDKIGLWGISRAGWICPLIITQYPIDFWISASGTDQFDSFRYLLKSNWQLQTKSDSFTDTLLKEWDFCLEALSKGKVDYNEFINGTKNLYNDSFYNSLGGTLPSETEFNEYQEYYENSGFVFDSLSGLQVMVEDFPKTLNEVNCPVLAIFGENDTQVDWRKTIQLYEKTIGVKSDSILTIKTIKNCNHNIQMCDTGGLEEDLKKYNWQACDNYYNTMLHWLEEIKILASLDK